MPMAYGLFMWAGELTKSLKGESILVGSGQAGSLSYLGGKHWYHFAVA
jgi:hypothetical protein